MKYSILLAALFLLLASCLTFSCNTDKLEGIIPEDCDTFVTYNDQVKAIVDNSCAYSGCHIGGSNPPGDFRTYDGMSPFLTDAFFKKYVIDLSSDTELGMPPAYAPEGKPQDLTAEELEVMRCWVASNYPEQ